MNYTTKLNKETQKGQHYIYMYNNASCISVTDFYSRPSYRKISIEKKIIEKMIDNKCYGYRVLGGNSSFFTCGYKSEDDKKLYIETQCNTFEIEL